jgi:hypothetical protein
VVDDESFIKDWNVCYVLLLNAYGPTDVPLMVRENYSRQFAK